MSVLMRSAALLLLVIATAYALDRCTLTPLRCAVDASRGASELNAVERQDDYAKRRVARNVHETLRDCESLSSPEAHVSFTMAEASSAMADHQTAIAEFRRALDAERRPEIYFDLGMTQLDALDRPGAIETLTRACAFDPARLTDIQYEDVRDEVARRIRATYGDDWLR